jgi:hypothetical protein
MSKKTECPYNYFCVGCIHQIPVWEDADFKGFGCSINAK